MTIVSSDPSSSDAPQSILRKSSADTDPASSPKTGAFAPQQPASLAKAGLTTDDVEKLICKLLANRGALSGRQAADHVGLSFGLMEPILRGLKTDMLVSYKNTAAINDFEYILTDMGRERARRYSEECTYFGAAPVTVNDYIDSVQRQSIADQRVTEDGLRAAFADLIIPPTTLRRLGPAVNSGRGMFLYGSPGNGKSSIAERITNCFGTEIWIPRAIGVDGQIIRVYDPVNHEELPMENHQLLNENTTDRRWVRIRRPTIAVGGELTMAELEIRHNPVTHISEAPLQLKSNCGTLIIDDFGRQRISTAELLNRWIVPLEKRVDFLSLQNGKKIQVPFNQLLIFSTNLEPRDLVDEAFLRRIPYKIQVQDPSTEEFRNLFALMGPQLGFTQLDSRSIDYLIQRHYVESKRPFRCCQPRDLLLQVRNQCLYQSRPLELTPELLDDAVDSYFAVM